MAAGFITKPLSTLLATAARWVEFADGSTAPVHGAVIVSPETGIPLTTKALISGASLWSVPSAGFASPKFLAANPDDSTGFDISGAASLVMAPEGTYSGAAGVLEQTLDESGASGWFPVMGRALGAVAAPSTGGATNGTGYIYPAVGVRARFRMGALSSGTFSGRFARSQANVALTIASA